MPIQLSKATMAILKELNSTFRLRMQFAEHPESVALRAERRKNFQDVPLPEGEYRTHVEIIDNLGGKAYATVMGEAGEAETSIIDRAAVLAKRKGCPTIATSRDDTSELLAENAKLRQELAGLGGQLLHATLIAKAGRRRTTRRDDGRRPAGGPGQRRWG